MSSFSLAVFAHRHGLPAAVIPYLNLADPRLMLESSSNTRLLALRDAKRHDELIVRCLLIPIHVTNKLSKNYWVDPTTGIEPAEYDGLLEFLLTELVLIIKQGIKHAREVRPYLYQSMYNAAKAYLAGEREFDQLPEEMDFDSGREAYGSCDYFLISPPKDIDKKVTQLYYDFAASCTEQLHRDILERRFRLPQGRLADFASDIAAELGLSTVQVVDELELLQRRYLKIVNDRRRSRNNHNYPALQPKPITRINRPEPQTISIAELAARIDQRKRKAA